MKAKHIFIISPAFYSHFKPLVAMGKSFKDQGLRVTIGSSLDFKEEVLAENLEFYEIDISKNKNLGTKEDTIQPASEVKRLEEFFQATRKGGVETLITQSNHRKANMLYDPEELIGKIRVIDEALDIDLYMVDILSYSVSLSLYFLNLDFITFCPPHPFTNPNNGVQYGVPKNWPSAMEAKKEDLNRLEKVAKNTEKEFTQTFNEIIEKNEDLEKTDNAFGLVSDIAVLYNYLDFDQREDSKHIYIGHSFEEKALDENWLKKVDSDEKKILISLGTFLSNRVDVLEKLIKYTRNFYPESIIIVSAGDKAVKLEKYKNEKTIIKDFIPQIALMPYMDLVIFHGGCNSFTESMYYGKNLLVLPFSSDQFNIAYDIEKNQLGKVLDPNNFSEKDLAKALEEIELMDKDSLKYWSHISKKRGPSYGVEKLLKNI